MNDDDLVPGHIIEEFIRLMPDPKPIDPNAHIYTCQHCGHRWVEVPPVFLCKNCFKGAE